MYLLTHLPTQSSIYPPIHLSIHLPTYPQHPLSSHPSFYLPSMHPHIIYRQPPSSICQSIDHSPSNLSIHLLSTYQTSTMDSDSWTSLHPFIYLLVHPPTDIPHPSTHHLSNFSYFILLSFHLLKSSAHYLLSHPATNPSTYHLCYSITLFQLLWKVAGRGIRKNSCSY